MPCASNGNALEPPPTITRTKPGLWQASARMVSSLFDLGIVRFHVVCHRLTYTTYPLFNKSLTKKWVSQFYKENIFKINKIYKLYKKTRASWRLGSLTKGRGGTVGLNTLFEQWNGSYPLPSTKIYIDRLSALNLATGRLFSCCLP